MMLVDWSVSSGTARTRRDQIYQPLLRWLDIIRVSFDHFLLVLELWRELLRHPIH